MNLHHTFRHTTLIAAALIATPSVFAGEGTAPFGINFTDKSGNPTSDFYDGVLFSDWTSAKASKLGTVSKPVTFTLPQGATGTHLSGWYATQNYWNPGYAGKTPSSIYGSVIGGDVTAGLAGHAALIQFSNVGAWLADNRFKSLKVTVYYASYHTLKDKTTDASSALASCVAQVFSGTLTADNAATFATDAQLLGTSSGLIERTGPYCMIGNTISGVTGDFVVAGQLSDPRFQGGIAAIKLEGVRIPEPATYGLMGAGALAAVVLVRRRQRAIATA